MKVKSRCEVPNHERNSEPVTLSSLEGLIQVTSGSFLCRLQVWTDQEWAELPESSRPIQCVHAPGLGWVGAVPVGCMN